MADAGEAPALCLPGGAAPPTFGAPWEAQAFAMALALHERGVFSWTEWAEALAQQVRAAQAAGDPDLGDTYYLHWLRALETLLERKGAAAPGELARLQRAWAQAAQRTPHGQPIELQPGDGAAGG